jgi:hypothetical protein
VPVGSADFLAASAEMNLLSLGLHRHFVVWKAVDDSYPCQYAALRAKISAAGHVGGVLLSGNLRQFPDPRK